MAGEVGLPPDGNLTHALPFYGHLTKLHTSVRLLPASPHPTRLLVGRLRACCHRAVALLAGTMGAETASLRVRASACR